MQKIVVEGGAPLNGEVRISGAKNAVLPILCATLLADGLVTLRNVPHLHDVHTTARLLAELGARVGDGGPGVVTVDPTTVNSHVAPYELVKTMRASVLVLGPLLAKLRPRRSLAARRLRDRSRPVDLHIKGLQSLGAQISVENGFIKARADKLRAARGTCSTSSAWARPRTC